jgi:hypothetical protein
MRQRQKPSKEDRTNSDIDFTPGAGLTPYRCGNVDEGSASTA